MALNCSLRSLLLSDDCAGKMLGCGCWSEEASPLSSCGVNSVWWDELDLELEFEEEEDAGGESDPVARLPSDPFGMNLEATSATITALAWCIEDFTARSVVQPFESGSNNDLFVDILNHAFIAFAPNPSIDGDMRLFEQSFLSGGPCGGDASHFSWLSPNVSCSQPSEFAEGPSNSQDAVLVCSDAIGAAPSGFSEGLSSSQNAVLACSDAIGATPGQEGNDVHPGLFFAAIGYLGLDDILSCEMVCKSLRSAVRSDICFWKCIHIDSHLGDKICDADLLCLTQKSPGDLQCLSLARCKNITDQGLKAVLLNNPQLTKVSIFSSSCKIRS
jgi:hypothetical protein